MGKHCPYLHQRGDRYYFFWNREDGRRVEESLRTADLEIAKQRYLERIIEIGNGCSPNDRTMWTLQQAADDRLEERRREVSKGSYVAERSILRNLLRVLGANSRLRSLADISKLRNYQHERLKAGKSPKTINNEMQVLRGILELAQLWHRVEREYRPLRVKRSDVPDALTKEESVRLLQLAAESPPMAVAPFVATLALCSGARKGEIQCLKLGDLHHREIQPFIQIRRVTTKTDAGSRRVALDSIGVWSVAKLLARASLIGSVGPEDYLLPTDRTRHTHTDDPSMFLTVQRFLPRITSPNEIIWNLRGTGHPGNWTRESVAYCASSLLKIILQVQHSQFSPHAIAYEYVYDDVLTAKKDGVIVQADETGGLSGLFSRHRSSQRRVFGELRRGQTISGHLTPTIEFNPPSKDNADLLVISQPKTDLPGKLGPRTELYVRADLVALSHRAIDTPTNRERFPHLFETD